LVLNIAFIGVWINKTSKDTATVFKRTESKGKDSKDYQKKYRNYLVKELKMDSVQAKEYNRMKSQHARKMSETIKAIDSLRILLGNQVFSENQDSARVMELIKVITTQKMIFEWNNINHLKDVKSILSEEQKIAFDKLHKKMMSKMKHGGGSPHRGEGGRSRQ